MSEDQKGADKKASPSDANGNGNGESVNTEHSSSSQYRATSARERVLASLPVNYRSIVIDSTRTQIDDDDPMWGVMYALIVTTQATLQRETGKIKSIAEETEAMKQAIHDTKDETMQELTDLLNSFGTHAKSSFVKERKDLQNVIEEMFDTSIKEVAVNRSTQLFRVFSSRMLGIVLALIGVGIIVGIGISLLFVTVASFL